jgi:hypothetical protein
MLFEKLKATPRSEGISGGSVGLSILLRILRALCVSAVNRSLLGVLPWCFGVDSDARTADHWPLARGKPTKRFSRVTIHGSRIAAFLIDTAAIRNVRNSLQTNNADHF